MRFQLNPIKGLQIAQRRLETAGVTTKDSILNAIERKAVTPAMGITTIGVSISLHFSKYW